MSFWIETDYAPTPNILFIPEKFFQGTFIGSASVDFRANLSEILSFSRLWQLNGHTGHQVR